MKQFSVYIMANRKHGTLYTGVTSDVVKRVGEHRNGLGDGFTAKHGLKTLVFVEACPDAETAITREKVIKRWRRQWKINLIEQTNPDWRDLYPDLFH